MKDLRWAWYIGALLLLITWAVAVWGRGATGAIHTVLLLAIIAVLFGMIRKG